MLRETRIKMLEAGLFVPSGCRPRVRRRIRDPVVAWDDSTPPEGVEGPVHIGPRELVAPFPHSDRVGEASL